MMSRKGKKRQRRQQSQQNPNKQARLARQRGVETQEEPAPASAQRTSSTVVALEALAPLIVRSGRPFDDQAGADPARFPPPSTLAGCLRTAWARATGQDFGMHLAQLSIFGPLLIDRNDQPLVPKPADATYFSAEDSIHCIRAEPKAFDIGCYTDLPNGLLPVQLAQAQAGKPSSGPRWWALDDFIKFRRGDEVPYCDLCRRGWTPSEGDLRTHVAIDPRTSAAAEGKLFQTEGLVLDARKAKDAAANGLRLLAKCDEPLGDCLVHLGGERRLAALEPQERTVWPAPPGGWLQDIVKSGGVCLTLLTPGIFEAGYCPGWLKADQIGSPPDMPSLQLQLCAVAVERWQAHSGWNLAKNQPRPSRKLAGAGTTYWFRILGGTDEAALSALWLANVSDDEQDRRDGFGLALPSPWPPVT